MSENIQSISQGTYTIGNTNELTFSAGPGIKIDQPSEGVVRIGNDETVLWSGTGNISSFTLSEKLSNFEKFRFVMAGYNTPQLGLCEYYSPADGSNISYCYEHYIANSDGNPLQVWAGRFSTTDSLTYNIIDWKWMCMPGTASAWSNTWNNNDRKPMIRKVIGINRISGSNA